MHVVSFSMKSLVATPKIIIGTLAVGAVSLIAWRALKRAHAPDLTNSTVEDLNSTVQRIRQPNENHPLYYTPPSIGSLQQRRHASERMGVARVQAEQTQLRRTIADAQGALQRSRQISDSRETNTALRRKLDAKRKELEDLLVQIDAEPKKGGEAGILGSELSFSSMPNISPTDSNLAPNRTQEENQLLTDFDHWGNQQLADFNKQLETMTPSLPEKKQVVKSNQDEAAITARKCIEARQLLEKIDKTLTHTNSIQENTAELLIALEQKKQCLEQQLAERQKPATYRMRRIKGQ